MKFWWTTIKEQKKEIEKLQVQLVIQDKLRNIENELHCLNVKIVPVPSITRIYTVDAVELANEFKKFPKLKRCGGGSCEMRYQIPVSEIDKIASPKTEPA